MNPGFRFGIGPDRENRSPRKTWKIIPLSSFKAEEESAACGTAIHSICLLGFFYGKS